MTNSAILGNPRLLSNEDLMKRSFVHQADMEYCLDFLNGEPRHPRHTVLFGPRGSGKTTLLCKLAIEIERNQDLKNRYEPVLLPDRLDLVTSLGGFMQEVARSLYQSDADYPTSDGHIGQSDLPSEEYLLDELSLALHAYTHRLGSRILVLIDNLDVLVSEQLKPEHVHQLIGFLRCFPSIVIIATTATKLKDLGKVGSELSQIMVTHELEPLQYEAYGTLWRSVVKTEQDHQALKYAIVLSSGDLHLFTSIARVHAQRGRGKIRQTTIRFIDQYWRMLSSWLNSIPPGERKVFVALSEIGPEAGALDISHITRMHVNKVSSYLLRLAARGLVSVIDSRGRTNLYRNTAPILSAFSTVVRHGSDSDRIDKFIQDAMQETEQLYKLQMITSQPGHD